MDICPIIVAVTVDDEMTKILMLNGNNTVRGTPYTPYKYAVFRNCRDKLFLKVRYVGRMELFKYTF